MLDQKDRTYVGIDAAAVTVGENLESKIKHIKARLAEMEELLAEMKRTGLYDMKLKMLNIIINL